MITTDYIDLYVIQGEKSYSVCAQNELGFMVDLNV